MGGSGAGGKPLSCVQSQQQHATGLRHILRNRGHVPLERTLHCVAEPAAVRITPAPPFPRPIHRTHQILPCNKHMHTVLELVQPHELRAPQPTLFSKPYTMNTGLLSSSFCLTPAPPTVQWLTLRAQLTSVSTLETTYSAVAGLVARAFAAIVFADRCRVRRTDAGPCVS